MKKKIIALCLIVSMLAIAVISGTIAYFTDVEDKDNTFVIGDIDIAIKESNGDGVDNGADGDGDGYDNWLDDQVLFPGVPVKKIVTVKNVGANSAYVRVTLTVPQYMVANFATGYTNDWTQISKTTDADNNTVYVFKYNTALEAGKETTVLLDNISVDKFIDDELNAKDALGNDAEKDVNVYAEAIQTAGFADVDAALAALDTQKQVENLGGVKIANTADELFDAMQSGSYVEIKEDVDKDVNSVTPYGNYTAFVQRGGVFDGNNKTLTCNDLGNNGRQGSWGIQTYGGTIKNVTVEGAFRGILIYSPTEDVILDNVTSVDAAYSLNTGEYSTTPGTDLIVENSRFANWMSFAGLDSASFTNCSFEVGSYFNSWPYDSLVKPIGINTLFKDSSFTVEHYLDLSELGAEATVTFENCTIGGTTLTSANASTLFRSGANEAVDNVSIYVELPAGRTIDDCIIIK